MNGLLLAVLLTGCVGVMPIPPARNEPTYGRVITKEAVRFIVPGQTTRAEVIAQLGDRFRASPRMPVIAYAWEKPACGWAWWLLVVSDNGAAAAVGRYDGDYWHAYFIKFDEGNRVTESKFVSLQHHQSVDQQLEDWATTRPKNFFASGAHVFNPETGVPWVFQWMQENSKVYVTCQ